jgi:hypothetical protein
LAGVGNQRNTVAEYASDSPCHFKSIKAPQLKVDVASEGSHSSAQLNSMLMLALRLPKFAPPTLRAYVM